MSFDLQDKNKGGRVPSEPGSRPSDQAPAGLGAPRFDPSRGEVKLATSNGRDRTVSAILLGSLAVHASVNAANGWTITHRATGCAIGHTNDEAKALSAAEEIQRQHPDAMTKLDKLAFGRRGQWKRRPPEVGRLVKTLEEMGLR